MNFREKLEKGEFVKLLETVPPKGTSLEKVMNYLKKFKGMIDATTVVDSPLGIARMHPFPVADKIQRQLRIESIAHFTCRDRNKMEIKTELLIGSTLKIKNILALTGDVPKEGKAVFEFNSINLIDFIQKFNERYNTDFFIGAALNINADVSVELKRANRKIEAGAKFFITQPCFDTEEIKKWRLSVPMIAGVLIVSNKKVFNYFNKVPGVKIPESLVDLLGNKEKILNYYRKLISDLEGTASGICLMPIGNYDIARELLYG